MSNRSVKGIFRNSLLNLFGQGLPLLIALYAMPVILKNIGAERLGILSLAWLFIGYFTLFDLGLGRALTKELSYWIPKDLNRSENILWTGILSTLGLGLIAGIAMACISPYLARVTIQMSDGLRPEALKSFLAIAICLPFVISSISLRGVMEARGQFLAINLIQLPLGVSNYLIPLFLSSSGSDLGQIVTYLMLSRILAWLTQAIFVLRNQNLRIAWNTAEFKKLIQFGGWITVSNLISPLMTYSDRLIIAASFSATAVAHYSTPFEMIIRLWIIPSSVLSAIFPVLASLSGNDKNQIKETFWTGVKYVAITVGPLGLLIGLFSHEILSLWLGKGFADSSYLVLSWLSAAIVVNSLAFVPAGFLQATQKAHIPAIILLIEIPIYFLSLGPLMNHFGIQGAAIAWFLRVLLDAILLFIFALRSIDSDQITSPT